MRSRLKPLAPTESATGPTESAPAVDEPGALFEGVVDRWATGGAGITRAPSGRLVLAADAAVGDRARIELTAVHKRHADGRVIEVVEPGPGRIEPACAHARLDAEPRCGGCDWQHLDAGAASAARRAIVADSFARLGRFDGDLPWQPSPELPALGYRTILRAAVADGRAGFRRARSHDVAVPDDCSIAHPLAAEILLEGRFGDVVEVNIKVGANTGERMVVVDGAPDRVVVPDDVIVVGRRELAAGRKAHIHEVIDGTRFRISADSFFQCRPDGASALVAAAADGLADLGDLGEGPVLDLYAGVGLFAGVLGNSALGKGVSGAAGAFAGRRVVAVEANPSSTADAAVNLPAVLDDVEVVTANVDRFVPADHGAGSAAAVIADPARKGLGRPGVATIVATGAPRVVLVSCDPAAAARDARLLSDAGYHLRSIRVVDLFGQTSHVEVVSAFERG